MENADEAIASLNDQDFQGRRLKINEARERQPRTSQGSYNRDGDRGYGSGGYDRGGYGR